MSFIQIQLVIFSTIIISSLIGGKKTSLIASAVWIIETMIVYRVSKSNYLQIITVSLSFQIGMLIAVLRDFIVKKIKKSTNKNIIKNNPE